MTIPRLSKLSHKNLDVAGILKRDSMKLRGDMFLILIRRLVCIGFPLVYFLFNLSYTRGPLFASSDEGGYLSWARVLAGQRSSFQSAVYPGWSTLLSPLYLISKDPFKIWVGVLAVNALLGMGILILSGRLLHKLAPSCSFLDDLLTVTSIAAFPLLPVMSGYAFPSVLSTFLLLCCAIQIPRISTGSHLSTILLIALVGLLFTVHPTHLVLSLSLLAVIFFSPHNFLTKTAYLLTPIFIFLGVKTALEGRLVGLLSLPDGAVIPTYGGFKRMSSLFNSGINEYLNLLRVFTTIWYSLIIATFGLIGIFIWSQIRSLRNLRSRQSRDLVGLFLLIALLGYVVVTAHSFGLVDDNTFINKRIEENIFLRYVEPVFPLVIIYGFAGLRNKNFSIRIIGVAQVVVVLVGTVLLSATVRERISLSGAPNLVDYFWFMANEFWPSYLVGNSRVLLWSTASLVLLWLVLKWNGSVLPIALLLLLPFVLQHQADFHREFFRKFSDPGPIPFLITDSYQLGTCVGFDTEISSNPFEDDGMYRRFLSFQETQFGNLSYWLGGFDFRRMSRSEWGTKCNGPLIAFQPVYRNDRVVALDSERQMVLIEDHFRIYDISSTSYFNLSVAQRDGKRCMQAGCFGLDALELRRWSEIGTLEANYLSTSSQQGVLFRTPGAILDKGSYFLELYGSFQNTEGSRIRVFADNQKTTILDSRLEIANKEERIRIPINLTTWVSDLQIECQVTSTSQFAISGVRIVSE